MKCGYSRERGQQRLVNEVNKCLTERKRLEQRKQEGPVLHTATQWHQIPALLYVLSKYERI